jgi:FXSXX-COOH protein
MDTDVADGLLLDVREISLEDLDLAEGSALDRALCRLLAGSQGTNFNSFGSSI